MPTIGVDSLPLVYTLRSAGQVLDAVVTPVEGGVDIAFAEVFDRGGLLEIDFTSTIYRQRTPFTAFLASGRDEGRIRQQVDVGDATSDIAIFATQRKH